MQALPFHRFTPQLCAALLVISGVGACRVCHAKAFQLVDKTRFLATPRQGVRINARSFYAYREGRQLISVHTLLSRSDTMDAAVRRFSDDNGETWGDAIESPTHQPSAAGMQRVYPRIGFVDPNKNILVEIRIAGTLPSDDPLEGMMHWSLVYRLSKDGGRTFYHEGPVVHEGEEYDEDHPWPGVWIGKNSIMIGDQSCLPIVLNNGELIQPAQITPLGPDGQYHNPGGGYTYHDAATLIGRWNDRETIDWTISSRVEADPNRSTRGMIEPTLAAFPDGRVLMVMRGSNDRRPELPGFRWYSVSKDRCRSWSPPQPWRFADGAPFHSPSSCSQLLTHSSGRIFWIGNVCKENPRGNLPRHPLVIGEVDRGRLSLVRDSLCVIDQRQQGDPEKLLLSNFFAREDRATGDILIHCSPIGRKDALVLGNAQQSAPSSSGVDWTADAWLYRVKVDP